MNEPEWIAYDVILAIHEAQIAEHGGLPGILNQSLSDSAIAHPKDPFAYAENVTLNRLAAGYAVRIAKNLGFVDGNKRTAWVTCAVFLELNGVPVTAGEWGAVGIMNLAAGGQINDEEFSNWLHPP